MRVPPELAELLGLRARMTQIHRAIWVYTTRKPLTRADHIDHLCGNRWCRNYDHIQPVSQTINNQRAAHTRNTGRRGFDRFDPDDERGEPIL